MTASTLPKPPKPESASFADHVLPDSTSQTGHPNKRLWTILLYLCGDYEPIHSAITEAAKHLEDVDIGNNCHLAIYRDRPDGARRYLSTQGEIEPLNKMNSGHAGTLEEFMQRAVQACPSERIALIFAGSGMEEPTSENEDADADRHYRRLFAFCNDDTDKDALDPVEVRELLEHFVERRGGRPIDVIGFDMSSMQYLEMAYQFEGLATFMVASQNNFPAPSWPYYDLIQEWGSRCHKPEESPSGKAPAPKRGGETASELASAKDFALTCVDVAGRAIDRNDLLKPSVTALDLRQLELVTRSLDTFFVAFMGMLGNKVVWAARDQAFHELLVAHYQNIELNDDANRTRLISFDLYELLQTICDQLSNEIGDPGRDAETNAIDFWYREELRQLHDPAKDCLNPIHEKRLEQQRKPSAEEARLNASETHRMGNKKAASKLKSRRNGSHDRLTLERVGDQLYRTQSELFSHKASHYTLVQKEFEGDLQTLGERLEDKLTKVKTLEKKERESGKPPSQPHFRDILERMLASYRLMDVEAIKADMEGAKHLLRIAREVAKLVHPTRKPTLDRTPFIIAAKPIHEAKCGVSIHRPEHLDRIRVNSQYLDLDFHRNVHWVSLLGAITLIRQHPGSMWKLISSLLATAGGAARSDLIERLVGPHSVMSGLGSQFKALKKPPCITLEITRGDHDPFLDADPITNADEEDGSGTYRLRLESSRRGATVSEHKSCVNQRTINNTLERLEELLQADRSESKDLHSLRSLGRTLGEDIVQRLNDNLRQEWNDWVLEDEDIVLHLQLQLSPQLMRFPWELMHDGKKFFGERYAMGRQVYMRSGLSKQLRQRETQGVRILIIGDPEFDAQTGKDFRQLPGAREEAKEVADQFERLGRELRGALDFARDRDVFIQEEITTQHFRELLREGGYDIIHFAGHALYDEKEPERSAWLFSDGPLWALEIRNTLARCESVPWLVFANACESSMGASKPTHYQSNVYGLATAFINEGVSAYLGPLWPINDAVALRMATDFYEELLLQRASLGEALRSAKRLAKDATLGATSALTGLSWASLVLYGDPTLKLLDSLGASAGPAKPLNREDLQIQEERDLRAKRRHSRRRYYTASGKPARPIQASVEETQRLVARADMELDLVNTKRTNSPPPPGKRVLELVEVNGARYWQYVNDRNEGVRQLPHSSVWKKLSQQPQLRERLGVQRGIGDYARIIGRWLIDSESPSLIEGLVAQYDRDQVGEQQLLTVNPDLTTHPLNQSGLRWINGDAKEQDGRVLLIIHGTFSSTDSPVKGLGSRFIRWACREYAAVIGFDHHTLSVSPEDNARNLWRLLDDRIKTRKRIDIITHSRGGLVARAFTELLGEKKNGLTPAEIVRRVIFVGTPNAGTSLANPKNWGQAADMLANIIHIDPDGIYGRLSGFFARFASLASTGAASFVEATLRQIPGLWAQNPQASTPNEFLGRLNAAKPGHSHLRHYAVSADYEPGGEMNLLKVWKDCADSSLDAFFTDDVPNDLVVNTGSVWGRSGKKQIATLAPWIAPENLLIYSPADSKQLPAEAQKEFATGVHHTNVMSYPRTREFITNALTEPDAGES